MEIWSLYTHIYTHEYTHVHQNSHVIPFYHYSVLFAFRYVPINIWRLKFESFFLSFSGTAGSWGKKKEREKKRALAPQGLTFWSVFIGPSSGVLRVQALPRFLSFVLAKVCQMHWAFVRQAKTTHRILSSVSNGWEGGLKGGYEGDKKPTYRGPGRFKARSHKGLWSVTSCRVVPDVIAGFPKIENHTQHHAPPHNILKEPLLKGGNAIESESLLHFD